MFAAKWMKPIVTQCASSLVSAKEGPSVGGSVGVKSLSKVFMTCPAPLLVPSLKAKAVPVLLAGVSDGICFQIEDWEPALPGASKAPIVPPFDTLPCVCPVPSDLGIPLPENLPSGDPVVLTAEYVSCCPAAVWSGVTP